MNQTDAQIIEWLHREYERPFEGWDFSALEGRLVTQGGLRWNYTEIVCDYLQNAKSLLDVGTGGGERLSRIIEKSKFTGRIEATESYAPNVSVARNRLVSYDVLLHDTSEVQATFEDGQFDLVIDRHAGGIATSEIFRILSRGGCYVTEQVGPHTADELRALFGVERVVWPNQPRDIDEASADMTRSGFVVGRLEENRYVDRFMDVGALVYYLKTVPHEVPGFSIDEYVDKLIALHRGVAQKGYAIDSTFHAWLLVAHKP